jgi:hypothetical protein
MQPRTRAPRLCFAVASVALVSGTIVVLASSGCPGAPGIIDECLYPIAGRMDHDGQLDECCMVDPCPGHCLNEPCPDGSTIDGGFDASTGGSATASCAGECVSLPPLGWQGPALLWLGPDGTEMACPAQAPVVVYQGHADPVALAPASCSACTCSISSGTCAPPAEITASTLPCEADGGVAFTAPFDFPTDSAGACTANDAIPAGNNIHSLTSGPLRVTESCMPSVATVTSAPAPGWQTAALACNGTTDPLGACADHGKTCVPGAAPPAFHTCIFQSGDNVCPAPYSDKYVVYAGFDDQRGCAACSCDAPAGSSCTGILGVYEDGACLVGVPLVSAISSYGPSCFDLSPPGPALGSKTVTGLAYQAGACAPGGGEPTGAVEPSGPGTFCCLMS